MSQKLNSIIFFGILALVGLCLLPAPTVAEEGIGTLAFERAEELLRYGKDPREPLRGGQTLNVFIWNVQKFPQPETFKDFLRVGTENDFLLVQEVIFSKPTETMLEQFRGHIWFGTKSFVNRWAPDGTGVVTGSRFLVSGGYAVQSIAKEPILNTPKMMLFNRLPVLDRTEEVLVVNVHGINFVLHADFESQMKQLESEIEKHLGPVILGGDFNTYTGSRFKVLQDMARRQNLVHSQPIDDKRRLRLDHLFVRGFDTLGIHLVYGIESSDHTPLKATLRLR